MRGAIEKGGLEQLDEVLEVVRLTGGLDYTRSRAQEMADNALNELKALPKSEFRDSLERIALLSVGRQA